ncbi:MAG: hypothetical protein NW226_25245, partial [Microscillaceae bacterium]|nr:hypothetical protein [Microscillaceae bacterium]
QVNYIGFILLELYQATQKGTVLLEDFPSWQSRYEQICEQAGREEPPPKKTPGENLKIQKDEIYSIV